MNKNLIKTILISVALFLFIGFMGYVIYVYGIYDKKNKDNFLEEFNNGNYSFLYENLNIKEESDFINEDKFNDVMGLMYNKNILKDVYYDYYKTKYKDVNEFFNYYFYGYNSVNLVDIEFVSYGKTSLFKRSKLLYKYVNVSNNIGNKSKLGIIENIKFYVNENGKLKVDGIEVSCSNGECNVSEMFGGLHHVTYNYNNQEFYALINVGYDKEFYLKDVLINVNGEEKEELTKDVITYKLETGRYTLKECYLESGCPYKRYSYIDLNPDGTVKMYIYISLDISGDTYEGTYEVRNNFLYLYFDKHIYKMHDYDTQERTEIVGVLDMEKSFKIVNEREIQNYDYSFIKK